MITEKCLVKNPWELRISFFGSPYSIWCCSGKQTGHKAITCSGIGLRCWYIQRPVQLGADLGLQLVCWICIFDQLWWCTTNAAIELSEARFVENLLTRSASLYFIFLFFVESEVRNQGLLKVKQRHLSWATIKEKKNKCSKNSVKELAT